METKRMKGVIASAQRARSNLRDCFVALLLAMTVNLLCTPVLAAPVIEENFYEGNKFYSEGKFAEAEQKYKAALSTGNESAALYFNLGNTYAKLGQKGKGVLYYQKALKLAPNDAELQFNLRFLQSQLEDKVVPATQNIFLEKFWGLVERFTERAWVTLFLAGYFVLFGLAALWLFWLRRRSRLGWVMLGVFSLWIFCAAGLIAKSWILSNPCGIVTSGKVVARYGPSNQEVTAFTLHEGTFCRVLGRNSDWLQIQLLDGKVAWVPQAALERI